MALTKQLKGLFVYHANSGCQPENSSTERYKVMFKDILWISTSEKPNYCSVAVNEVEEGESFPVKYMCKYSLTEIMAILPETFVRISQSCIVNIHKIEKLQSNHAIIIAGNTLHIKEHYKKPFKASLDEFYKLL